MHRNETSRNPERTQSIGGQPRTNDEDDELQDPDTVPSFLTARELQAKDPAKSEPQATGERDATASFRGNRAQPPISDDNPPRDERGQPEPQTNKMVRKPKGDA